MSDMIEIEGVLRPATSEKAEELAAAIEQKIYEARLLVENAHEQLKQTCLEMYPVGSRVTYPAGKGRPTFEVKAVTPGGYLDLENIKTGKTKQVKATDFSLSPCRCWYERVKIA